MIYSAFATTKKRRTLDKSVLEREEKRFLALLAQIAAQRFATPKNNVRNIPVRSSKAKIPSGLILPKKKKNAHIYYYKYFALCASY